MSSSDSSTNIAIGRASARLTAKYSSSTSRDGLPRSISTMSGPISSIRASSPRRSVSTKISQSGICASPSSMIVARVALSSTMAILMRDLLQCTTRLWQVLHCTTTESPPNGWSSVENRGTTHFRQCQRPHRRSDGSDWVKRFRSWRAAVCLAGLLWPVAALAQEAGDVAGQGQPDVVRPLTPIPPERLEQMVPKHPGYLGALAPENLQKPRPPAPFDLTGTWFVDLSEGLRRLHVRPALPEVLRPRPRGADRAAQGAGARRDLP
jgi:hypothetical protein